MKLSQANENNTNLFTDARDAIVDLFGVSNLNEIDTKEEKPGDLIARLQTKIQSGKSNSPTASGPGTSRLPADNIPAPGL